MIRSISLIRSARILMLLALLLCATAGCGATRKPAPAHKAVVAEKSSLIPAGPSAYTHSQFDKVRLAYYNRVIVEAYRAHGDHTAKWDKAALAFLTEYCDSIVHPLSLTDGKRMTADGQAIVAQGCQDPLVLSCCGISLMVAGDSKNAESLLRTAVDTWDKSSYPHCRASMAAMNLVYLLSHSRITDMNECGRLTNIGTDWLSDVFKDGSFQQGDDRLAVEQISHEYELIQPTYRSEFLDAVEKAPGKSPWLASYISGWCEVERAWQARGDAYANRVTEEQWRGFAEHLTAARGLLTTAYKLHPDYPEASTLMIKVAMGGASKGETARLWFKRAVAAQADYGPAYSHYLWDLRPRWEGSLDEEHQFGLACLATKRFDTIIPYEYMAALMDINDDLKPNKHYWQLPETWQRLQAMCDGYAKTKNPILKDQYECQTLRAAAAALCERYPDARKILIELGDHVDEPFFEQFVPGPGSVAAVEALGGKYGPQMLNAEKLLGQRSYDKALAAYLKLQAPANSDKYSKDFIESRIATIKWARDYEANNRNNPEALPVKFYGP